MNDTALFPSENPALLVRKRFVVDNVMTDNTHLHIVLINNKGFV